MILNYGQANEAEHTTNNQQKSVVITNRQSFYNTGEGMGRGTGFENFAMCLSLWPL